MLDFFTQFFENLSAIFMAILVALGISSPKPTIDNNPKMTSVFEFGVESDCYAVQGGCTDGRYMYVAMINAKEETSGNEVVSSRIIKIDSYQNQWKKVSSSDELDLDHANDMTYNSKLNKLIVSNNKPNYSTVSVVDPNSLKVENTYKIELSENFDVTTTTLTNDDLTYTDSNNQLKKVNFCNIYSISYDDSEDCYYCGTSNKCNFVKLTSDFKVVDAIKGVSVTYTRQANAFDSSYIYSLFYKPNSIFKYTKSGEYQGCFELPITTNEAEFVCFLNGCMYVGYNILSSTNGGIIYKVENENFKVS